MKVLCTLILAGVSLMAGSLSDVKTVYLMPMASGLDQHLAVALTSTGTFEVSTDPAAADAVFTDHIGNAFEQSLSDLYKPEIKPEEKAGAKADAKDAKAAAKSAKEEVKSEDGYVRPTSSMSSRGRGDIFLVDRKTRVVLWSMYATPKSSQSSDLNELAGKIAAKIQKDRKGK